MNSPSMDTSPPGTGNAQSFSPVQPDVNDFVSVIIPCYNEERFILKALEQLGEQYDPDRYEIIVVDGMSEDHTRSLFEEFRQSHGELTVRMVDNPLRHIPVALNLGMAAARGSIIARMDAHAVPSDDYIRRCVEVLKQSEVGVVGMPCRVQAGADGLMAAAIAGAVSHPFGIGDAKYRLREGESLQEAVDTVAFACFKKSLWAELGGFNEELWANEDYDFNYRVRLSGRQVMLDRSGHCDYFARATLKGLAQQYLRYGRWKAQMVKLHPRSIKWRHLVAPIFVISIVTIAAAGLFWRPAWAGLMLELALYLLVAFVCGWQIARRNKSGLGMILLMPLVFFTIHLAWGTSFLAGLTPVRRRFRSMQARIQS